MPELKAGDAAPEFSMPTDTQEMVSLSELKGKPVVLYFYPKDDTPGCTKEAISFSEMDSEFKNAGAMIIGVSRDTVTKHAKFRDKHNLSVLLGSDEDGQVTEDYGVWVEKKMYGRTYMGIERATFLLDGSGKIAHVWRKVKVPGHAESVLEAVKAL